MQSASLQAENIGDERVAISSVMRFGFRKKRKADLDRSRKIANIVYRHDGRWWNGSRAWKREPSLSCICAGLDHAEIPIPSSWRQGRTPALSRIGLDLRGWADALDLGYRRLAVGVIDYHLERLLRGQDRCGTVGTRAQETEEFLRLLGVVLQGSIVSENGFVQAEER